MLGTPRLLLWLGGSLSVIFNVRGLVIVLGAIMVGAAATLCSDELAAALAVPRTEGAIPRLEADRAIAVFGQLARLSVAGGLFGILLRVIAGFDETTTPAMAVFVLPLLVGVVLGELMLRSAAADLRMRRGDVDSLPPIPSIDPGS